MTVTRLPTEQDEFAANLEKIKRYAPERAKAMMENYKAYLEAGFDQEAALYFVASEYLAPWDE